MAWKSCFLVKDEVKPRKRLMWVSPSPDMQSSFSVVSQELLKRLQGYEILYLGQHYYGEPRPEKNYLLAPYSSGDHILYYTDVFKPNVTLLFQSPAYLNKLSSVLQMIKDKTRLILYTPIEGYPMTVDIDPLYSTANLVIVPSRYSQECLQKHGYLSEVLNHGVDPSIFRPAPKPDNFTVGSISSHVWRKQLPRIIDAHRLCMDKGFSIRLLIVASTYDFAPWQPPLKKYAEKISPTAWFHETAYLNLPVSRKTVADLYNQMHCHLLPSTESFGLPNLEAMASGTVPIIVDHGGSPEVVGDCGIYVKVKDYLDTAIGKVALVDVEDLADKIVWAYQHPNELRRLAAKGYERAKVFNWNNIVGRLEVLLEGEAK